jgi:hypothetical protein
MGGPAGFMCPDINPFFEKIAVYPEVEVEH